MITIPLSGTLSSMTNKIHILNLSKSNVHRLLTGLPSALRGVCQPDAACDVGDEAPQEIDPPELKGAVTHKDNKERD